MELFKKSINPENLDENVFSMIGEDWMLITAGAPDHYNTMTASWGGMGVLWNRNVCFVFIRPVRYTYEFMEKTETFSLSFFGEEWRKALNICGTKSGRNIDKAAAAGLTPLSGSFGTTVFKQARLVLTCRKLYYQDIDPKNFLDGSLDKNYPDKDYHRMYVGEILEAAFNEAG